MVERRRGRSTDRPMSSARAGRTLGPPARRRTTSTRCPAATRRSAAGICSTPTSSTATSAATSRPTRRCASAASRRGWSGSPSADLDRRVQDAYPMRRPVRPAPNAGRLLIGVRGRHLADLRRRRAGRIARERRRRHPAFHCTGGADADADAGRVQSEGPATRPRSLAAESGDPHAPATVASRTSRTRWRSTRARLPLRRPSGGEHLGPGLGRRLAVRRLRKRRFVAAASFPPRRRSSSPRSAARFRPTAPASSG